MPRITTKKVTAKPAPKKAEHKPIKRVVVKAPVRKIIHKKPEVKEVVKILEPIVVVQDKEKVIAGDYLGAVGRRKTSVARIRIFTKGEKKVTVNGKSLDQYFGQPVLQKIIMDPLEKMNVLDKFGVTILVRGGGLSSQAGAIRHGISRALVKFNIDFRKRLKRAGFLTRDSRERERKKFGLKRARKAPQWAKR